jgi:hypothetical protein
MSVETAPALNRMRELLDRPALHPFEEFPLDRKPSLGELFGEKRSAPAAESDKPSGPL